MEFNEAMVCVDCGFMIANGEELPDNEGWKPEDMDNTVNWFSGSNDDDEFSMTSCDCCGSYLAGRRMSAMWSEK